MITLEDGGTRLVLQVQRYSCTCTCSCPVYTVYLCALHLIENGGIFKLCVFSDSGEEQRIEIKTVSIRASNLGSVTESPLHQALSQDKSLSPRAVLYMLPVIVSYPVNIPLTDHLSLVQHIRKNACMGRPTFVQSSGLVLGALDPGSMLRTNSILSSSLESPKKHYLSINRCQSMP